MKAKISRLNSLYESGVLTIEAYKSEAAKLLCSMDWQKRLQFENMLFVSIV